MKTFIALLLMLTSSIVFAKRHYVRLELVFVDDLSEIPMQMYKNGHPILRGIFKKKNGICRVYVKEPENFEDLTRLEILGHEVFHCIVGPHTDEYVRKHYKKIFENGNITYD